MMQQILSSKVAPEEEGHKLFHVGVIPFEVYPCRLRRNYLLFFFPYLSLKIELYVLHMKSQALLKIF